MAAGAILGAADDALPAAAGIDDGVVACAAPVAAACSASNFNRIRSITAGLLSKASFLLRSASAIATIGSSTRMRMASFLAAAADSSGPVTAARPAAVVDDPAALDVAFAPAVTAANRALMSLLASKSAADLPSWSAPIAFFPVRKSSASCFACALGPEYIQESASSPGLLAAICARNS